MRRLIKARIAELQTARDAYVVQANATVRDYDVAIAELGQLLTTAARPARSALQEEPPPSDSSGPHR